MSRGKDVEYAVCSPDLWNRRQDTGESGFEVMQRISGMPPMRAADNRRVAGWRILREYLRAEAGAPILRISSECTMLTTSLPALLCSPSIPEDASDRPHVYTHAPEALRYAVMSRAQGYRPSDAPDRNFRFSNHKTTLRF